MLKTRVKEEPKIHFDNAIIKMLIETHIECCLNINCVYVSCHTGSASEIYTQRKDGDSENMKNV